MTSYSAPVGAPIWFDLMSSDPAKAADFYREIFGWEVEGPPQEEFGGYQNFTLHGKRISGLNGVMGDGGGPTDIWSVYLHTEDAAATGKAVEAAGGSIMVPPMPVGDLGTMMVAVDSAGAAIGFWQPGTHRGFVEWGVHGAPYWFESQTKDYAASTSFYPAVTGARLDEIGTGGAPDAVGPEHYSQVFWGDRAYGGIMDATKLFPPEVPSFWQIYIMVDDVATTVTKAEQAGGKVLTPAEETPYGTLAAITDPFGAQICLGHPPAGM